MQGPAWRRREIPSENFLPSSIFIGELIEPGGGKFIFQYSEVEPKLLPLLNLRLHWTYYIFIASVLSIRSFWATPAKQCVDYSMPGVRVPNVMHCKLSAVAHETWDA